MTYDKAQLNDLKTELDIYKKKLLDIQKTYKSRSGKDLNNIYKSLSHMLAEAGEAYTKLESASEEEWDILMQKANESFRNLKKSFDKAVADSSDQVKEYVHNIEEYSHEVMDSAEEYIKKNPLRSVLYAVGLGYFIGRFRK